MRFLWIIIVIILVSGCLTQPAQEIVEPVDSKYSCQSDTDCMIKKGQCSMGCYHQDYEPESDPTIMCKFRPWFMQERCECVNSQCAKITCEDLGLNYTQCNQ